MDVKGKVVVVTGGGGGIGAGIAEAFAEKGAKVAITDINLDYAKAEAARIGGGVLAFEHDVASPESWDAVLRLVEQAFGPVDVLCNNAGVAQAFKPFEHLSLREFERMMAINVTGVFNGCQAVIPAMKARGAGHIVNTASVNGQLPFGSFAGYCASKFAVVGLSEAIAQELAPTGVGVSILYPGLTRSRMSESQQPALSAEKAKELSAMMMEAIWLGRAVVRAVESGELHIITHPDHKQALQQRIDGLFAAYGEPAQPGYSGGRIPAE